MASLVSYFDTEWCNAWFRRVKHAKSWNEQRASTNPNLTAQMLFELMNVNMSNELALCGNPNFTVEHILKKPFNVCDWYVLSSHKNISFDDVANNPHFPWRFDGLLKNPNFTKSMLKSCAKQIQKRVPQSRRKMFSQIKTEFIRRFFKTATIDELTIRITQNPNGIQQYFVEICGNPNITVNFVKTYLWGFFGVWGKLSANYIFATLQTILDNIGESWDFRHIAYNPNISYTEYKMLINAKKHLSATLCLYSQHPHFPINEFRLNYRDEVMQNFEFGDDKRQHITHMMNQMLLSTIHEQTWDLFTNKNEIATIHLANLERIITDDYMLQQIARF